MLMCMFLCLLVLIYVFTCFILSSMCLCAPCHVCVPRPRLCLSCHVLLQLFCSFYRIFFVFWPNGQDPIQTLWSLSSPIHQCPHQKSSDHSYLHVYACLLLCFMLVLASLVLGFAMLGTLRRLDLVWLHPTPMRPCSDVTIQEASPDAGLLRVYPSLFAPHDAMLTMFVCATHWLSMHLYTLAYMFPHKSCLLVCRPYFNTMKL